MDKQCKTCEFNSNGTCCECNDLYDYGGKITDDSKCCENWSADLDYFTYVMKNAPRFMRDLYEDSKISYDEFLKSYDDYIADKAIPINFFDAMKMIYDLSMIDIAVLLDVSFGVVYRAKTRGIPKKRINQFASALCVKPELLEATTTADIKALYECKKIFYKQPNIHSRIVAMPQWKKDLARTLSSLIHCSLQSAEVFTRIDNIHWMNDMKIEEFTESEKIFINFMSKKTYDNKQCIGLDYYLDIASRHYLRIKFKPIHDISRIS